MSPADIKELIAVMREQGVTRLKDGDLELELGPLPSPPPKRFSPVDENDLTEAELAALQTQGGNAKEFADRLKFGSG